MFEIEIANSQSSLELDEEFLREVSEETLRQEQVADAHVSVALVDDKTLRELNRQYLDHDYDTDVLSFLLEGDPADKPTDLDENQPRLNRRIEGEVVVSTEMALRRAEEFSWRPQDEVVLYLVHGLLHLVGYDDRTDAQKDLMRSRERSILQVWDLCSSDSAGLDAPGTAGHAPGEQG